MSARLIGPERFSRRGIFPRGAFAVVALGRGLAKPWRSPWVSTARTSKRAITPKLLLEPWRSGHGLKRPGVRGSPWVLPSSSPVSPWVKAATCRSWLGP
jgi:hypothetical protein